MARRALVIAAVLLAVATGCVSSDGDSAVTTVSSSVPGVQSSVTTSTSTTVSTTSTTRSPTTTTATTTTTPPEPPLLEVLDPVHGATVTTPRYTFTGVTNPGATVTVGGKYEATVDPDGSWELVLVLVLEPGQNSTTFVATHPANGLETQQAIRVYYAVGLELRPDGLGAVTFGQDETSTMAILTGLLGPPHYESTCNDLDYCTGAGYGWCPYIRTVSWGWDQLSIVIADCESIKTGWPEAPELVTWRIGQESTLRTPEGVGPGSTLGELETVYGDRFVVGYDECAGGLFFAIRSPNGEGGLRGHIPTPPGFEEPDDNTNPRDLVDPSTRVFGFAAGWAQSC